MPNIKEAKAFRIRYVGPFKIGDDPRGIVRVKDIEKAEKILEGLVELVGVQKEYIEYQDERTSWEARHALEMGTDYGDDLLRRGSELRARIKELEE